MRFGALKNQSYIQNRFSIVISFNHFNGLVKKVIMSIKQSNTPTLIAFIRFQLEQLSSRNAHHEFEHLCRHLARNTITTNLLPATGPVSAGGDQGKDFETFTSFISEKKSDSIFFGGCGESKLLVFACSLTQKHKVKSKIEADIREICSKNKPYIIYFYSSQDIPIGARHKLIAWSLDSFDVNLEIIDGQAISELLSAPNLFWIAEEFLDTPSDLFPQPQGKESWYSVIKENWLINNTPANNHADFVSIKSGLRHATYEESAKPDLNKWIKKIEYYVTGVYPDLKRRAIYEICVAALRGHNDLNSKRFYVEEYFGEWLYPDETSALRDTTILLSYCSTAVLLGVFDFSKKTLQDWSQKLTKHINNKLSQTTSANTITELLVIRSHASHLPFTKSLDGEFDRSELFKWWNKVLASAKRAPLFPIEDFSDLVNKVLPYIDDGDELDSILRKIDDLLEERSKGYVVAEKSRDRAISYLENNKTLRAIDELHKAKVRWFTGDALEGTILTLFTLSNAYNKLGLCYAAKYYALGALFVIFNNEEDYIKSYLPDALVNVAECCYLAGDWMTFSNLFSIFLVAHYQYDKNPNDWEKPNARSMIFHWYVTKSIAKALGGTDALKVVEAPIHEMNMPSDIRQALVEPDLPLEKYEKMTIEEISQSIVKEINAFPFNDCGSNKIYKWAALGIIWCVTAENKIESIPYAEEFVAILQILIADFGMTDLCLLPTTIYLNMNVVEHGKMRVDDRPDKELMSFDIIIPKNIEIKSSSQAHDIQDQVLAVANAILIQCSCLPDSEVHKKLNNAYKNGLVGKAFLVRPYSELLFSITIKDEYKTRHENSIGNLNASEFPIKFHDELTWNDSPGYGYNKKKANEFLSNRYRRGLPPIRLTLNKLRKSPEFQKWIASKREERYLDWQILIGLANVVINYRVNKLDKNFDPRIYYKATSEMLNAEETDSDTEFPEAELYKNHLFDPFEFNLTANGKTWGLVLRRSANPDFKAYKKVLDVKYFQATDDIPHDDLFSMIKA